MSDNTGDGAFVIADLDLITDFATEMERMNNESLELLKAYQNEIDLLPENWKGAFAKEYVDAASRQIKKSRDNHIRMCHIPKELEIIKSAYNGL